MKPELMLLAWAVVLTLVQMLVAASGAASQYGVMPLFGNRDAGDAEGEIFLGETRVRTNGGQTPFTMEVAAPVGSVPTSFTATVTTSDGATSEFTA